MMQNALKKFIRYSETHGVKKALQTSMKRLAGSPAPQAVAASDTGITPPPASILAPAKTDVIGFYEDILGHDHGSAEELAQANPDENTLQWVIPNFGFGSGGHLNIFRFINKLAELGMKQKVVILPPFEWKNASEAKAKIDKWYFELNAEVSLGVEGFSPSHFTIATGWQTAYWVAKYQATREKFYFVQDFEPSFYSVSSEYYFAENTYRLGLKGITAGGWLQEKLSSEYGMECGAVSFSFDREMYKPLPKDPSPNFNILFYSRHVTKRRLFELGLCALKQVCEKHPEVAVIFAGGDVSGFDIPFHHLNAGELTLAELPNLYSQCDLALVLSGTNLSLLPLEVAACKCPLVMNDTPSSRWLLPEDAAYYAGMDPTEMADVISQAITDTEGRAAKVEVAYQQAQDSSWDREAQTALNLLRDLSA